MDRYSLIVIAMLVTSCASETLAGTTRDAEKNVRAEYLKLCNFYLISIPTELYVSTSMDGCRENPQVDTA